MPEERDGKQDVHIFANILIDISHVTEYLVKFNTSLENWGSWPVLLTSQSPFKTQRFLLGWAIIAQNLLCSLVTYLYKLKICPVARGRGCRGAMIPAKMTSEPLDLQNYLQAPQKLVSQPQWRHQASYHSVSTPRILAPIKFFLAFINTKNLFFKFSTWWNSSEWYINILY